MSIKRKSEEKGKKNVKKMKKSEYNVYVFIIHCCDDLGPIAAKDYGYDKILNEYINENKTHFMSERLDEVREYFSITVETYTYGTEHDANQALSMLTDTVSDIYDGSECRDYFTRVIVI